LFDGCSLGEHKFSLTLSAFTHSRLWLPRGTAAATRRELYLAHHADAAAAKVIADIARAHEPADVLKHRVVLRAELDGVTALTADNNSNNDNSATTTTTTTTARGEALSTLFGCGCGCIGVGVCVWWGTPSSIRLLWLRGQPQATAQVPAVQVRGAVRVVVNPVPSHPAPRTPQRAHSDVHCI
jgi:hypothetical protein